MRGGKQAKGTERIFFIERGGGRLGRTSIEAKREPTVQTKGR
jgi:hypothetical protein